MKKIGTYKHTTNVLLKNGTELDDCTLVWDIFYTVDSNYGADADGNRGTRAYFTDEVTLKEVEYGEHPIDEDDISPKDLASLMEQAEEEFFMSDQCDKDNKEKAT